MRILQSYMAVTGEMGKNGISPLDFAIWPKEPLIDDGAGFGHSAVEDELLTEIYPEVGLLLQAKDVDTMLRGLRKINQDQTITGQSGLAVIAMQHNTSGGTSLLKSVPKGQRRSRGAGTVVHKGSFTVPSTSSLSSTACIFVRAPAKRKAMRD